MPPSTIRPNSPAAISRTMKTASKKIVGKKSPVAKPNRVGSSDPAVDAVFDAYPGPIKAKLLALRRLIFDAASTTTLPSLDTL